MSESTLCIRCMGPLKRDKSGDHTYWDQRTQYEAIGVKCKVILAVVSVILGIIIVRLCTDKV